MIQNLNIIIPEEILEIFKQVDTPERIQSYIDNKIIYDPYREDRSVFEVLRDGKAECYNGSLLACAFLMFHGFQNVGLVAITPLFEGDEEHALAVYQVNGRWASIGQSKFRGLKSREPIYVSIHDLAVSYKESYFEFDGHYSMRGHTDFYSLDKYNYKWLNDSEVVKHIDDELFSIKGVDTVGPINKKIYIPVDKYWHEVIFIPKEKIIPELYLKGKPHWWKQL